MKDTCENCSDFANCPGICDKISRQLEKLPKWSPEIPESQLDLGDIESGKKSDNSALDLKRKIDPAKKYEDAIDIEIDWEETLPQPEAAEIEEPERKRLTDAIMIATRQQDIRFKRCFLNFLKCQKIAQIASRSGTTKQNMQKRFQLVINKVYSILKNNKAEKNAITPLKFKKKVFQSDS